MEYRLPPRAAASAREQAVAFVGAFEAGFWQDWGEFVHFFHKLHPR
jgi:hypothetical protein